MTIDFSELKQGQIVMLVTYWGDLDGKKRQEVRRPVEVLALRAGRAERVKIGYDSATGRRVEKWVLADRLDAVRAELPLVPAYGKAKRG